MYRSNEVQTSPGVAGNARLTGGVAAALLVGPHVAGPPSDTLKFAHKLSFIAWVALMALHVLGHVLEVPALALPDWRRNGPPEARLAGASARTTTLGLAILTGAVLALLTYSAAGSWF